jgi:MoaA/NifB/PqqE/SkfB family radical SAM enzyme
MFDIDVEYFTKFLTLCNPEFILFCGNYGDPIYSKDFIGLIRILRTTFPELIIMIHTNGSGKDTAWWEELMSILGPKDTIVFSIDGTPDNYTKYRINSKWDDVENAVKTVISYKKKYNLTTQIQWKHLVFSYNENRIIEAYKLSIDMGFDDFLLQYGLVNMYEKNAWLQPSRPFHEIEEEFNEQKYNPLL